MKKNNIFTHNGGEAFRVNGDPSLRDNYRLKICPKTIIIERRDPAGDWVRNSSFPLPVTEEHAARLVGMYGLTEAAVEKITKK